VYIDLRVTLIRKALRTQLEYLDQGNSERYCHHEENILCVPAFDVDDELWAYEVQQISIDHVAISQYFSSSFSYTMTHSLLTTKLFYHYLGFFHIVLKYFN